jgi:hypothetical protein
MMPSPSYVPLAQARRIYAEAATDTLVTGTTAQTATVLQVPVEANKKYVLTQAGIIFAISNGVAAAAIGWSGPVGATMKWNSYASGSTSYRSTIGAVDSYSGSASTRLAFFSGRLVVGDAAGFLTVTISTSDIAQTATLFQDSWLLLDKVT